MLEDHADAAAQGDQALAVVAADVFVVDQHLPLAGTLQAIEGADQRGLSGAAAADDAEHFAAADFQVDLPQGLDSTGVALAQAVETDLQHAHGARPGAVGIGSRASLLTRKSQADHDYWLQPGWYSVPWALSSAARTTGECW